VEESYTSRGQRDKREAEGRESKGTEVERGKGKKEEREEIDGLKGWKKRLVEENYASRGQGEEREAEGRDVGKVKRKKDENEGKRE
jgi:hypothetical protein